MFIGHFALGFAAKGAKRLAPGVSLGTFFLAAQLADLVWPTLVLLGLERVEVRPGITAVTPLDFVHYPYSHSLVALLAWGVGFALVYRFARRRGGSAGGAGTLAAAVTLAALVLSHWLLDFVTHRPDMPLTLTGPARLGLGLWHSRLGTLAVELAMFAAGVWLYVRATRPRDRTGRLALAGLVGFLLLVSLANLVSPPPPSAAAVVWAAQATWLLVAWGYWVDRHRTS